MTAWMAAEGSSPHTRGAPPRGRPAPGSTGIIPAYAGSTFPSLASTSARRDHPRIRGEHTAVSIAKGEAGGSSPHTRGARSAPASPTSNARIIPAYAGSTPCRLRLSGRLPDHPRIRGEHRRARFPPSIRGGSSPHTRGALDVPRLDLLRVRIIPAYAGSTGAERLTYDKTGDHPRIRGEHPMLPMMVWNVIGSSPHTRGARSTGRRYAAASGIIPAYAGSTPCLPCARPRPADHPRIRGEHQAALALLARMLGSSPHTRGAPVKAYGEGAKEGIIPAYAGSTRA